MWKDGGLQVLCSVTTAGTGYMDTVPFPGKWLSISDDLQVDVLLGGLPCPPENQDSWRLRFFLHGSNVAKANLRSTTCVWCLQELNGTGCNYRVTNMIFFVVDRKVVLGESLQSRRLFASALPNAMSNCLHRTRRVDPRTFAQNLGKNQIVINKS